MLFAIFLAQTTSPTSTSGRTGSSGLSSLLFFAVLIGVFWMFIIRPQQRARRSQTELIRTLEIGDQIETAAGMFGVIRRADETTLWVELAPNLTVRMARGAVRRKVLPGESSPE